MNAAARPSEGGPGPPPPRADPWPEGRRLSDFERAVVDAIAALGPGDLASYGEIAQEVGRPGAAQAVGNVVRRARSLPWWRIVPADGKVYCTHAPVQVPLLEAEGHVVQDRQVVATDG